MKHLLIAFLFGLAGCASSSGVIEIGPDTYMVSREAGSGYSGANGQKTLALKEAGQFCTQLKKNLRVTEVNMVNGGIGVFPRADVSFMCLEKGDADLTRPGSPNAPDQIYEIRHK